MENGQYRVPPEDLRWICIPSAKVEHFGLPSSTSPSGRRNPTGDLGPESQAIRPYTITVVSRAIKYFMRQPPFLSKLPSWHQIR